MACHIVVYYGAYTIISHNSEEKHKKRPKSTECSNSSSSNNAPNECLVKVVLIPLSIIYNRIDIMLFWSANFFLSPLICDNLIFNWFRQIVYKCILKEKKILWSNKLKTINVINKSNGITKRVQWNDARKFHIRISSFSLQICQVV